MLLPAACLFLRRYKSRTDDKQPLSVSVDSVYLERCNRDCTHWDFSDNHSERLTTPLEYELWFLSTLSPLWKSSERYGSLDCTPRQLLFLFPSRSCLLLRLQILARQITTLAIVSLSVPVSTRTQFVRLDSEKIVSESFTDRLAIVSDISLSSTGFLARLSVSLQICLPDSSL